MKRLLCTLLAGLMLGNTTQAGWFNNSSDNERRTEQRAAQLENQLHQQQETTSTWRLAAFTLALGCVIVLIIGTAIGAKGRRDAQRK